MLHKLGTTWHVLPAPLQAQLSAAIWGVLLAAMAAPAPGVQPGSEAAEQEGQEQALPVPQCLLLLEPQQAWWHRLAAMPGPSSSLAAALRQLQPAAAQALVGKLLEGSGNSSSSSGLQDSSGAGISLGSCGSSSWFCHAAVVHVSAALLMSKGLLEAAWQLAAAAAGPAQPRLLPSSASLAQHLLSTLQRPLLSQPTSSSGLAPIALQQLQQLARLRPELWGQDHLLALLQPLQRLALPQPGPQGAPRGAAAAELAAALCSTGQQHLACTALLQLLLDSAEAGIRLLGTCALGSQQPLLLHLGALLAAAMPGVLLSLSGKAESVEAAEAEAAEEGRLASWSYLQLACRLAAAPGAMAHAAGAGVLGQAAVQLATGVLAAAGAPQRRDPLEAGSSSSSSSGGGGGGRDLRLCADLLLQLLASPCRALVAGSPAPARLCADRLCQLRLHQEQQQREPLQWRPPQQLAAAGQLAGCPAGAAALVESGYLRLLVDSAGALLQGPLLPLAPHLHGPAAARPGLAALRQLQAALQWPGVALLLLEEPPATTHLPRASRCWPTVVAWLR
jgi:hypothetical protein